MVCIQNPIQHAHLDCITGDIFNPSILAICIYCIFTYLHIVLRTAGFRLNTTPFLAEVVFEKIDCILECAAEECCRSINYRKVLKSANETNCEMLHSVINNTGKKLLKDPSFDHAYLVNPQKVNLTTSPA